MGLKLVNYKANNSLKTAKSETLGQTKQCS